MHAGDNFAIWGAELKSQRKLVKSLKKKSLWSKSLEEVGVKTAQLQNYLCDICIVHNLILGLHPFYGYISVSSLQTFHVHVCASIYNQLIFNLFPVMVVTFEGPEMSL